MSDHATLIMLALALTFVVAVLVGVGADYLFRCGNATCPTAFSRAAFASAASLTLAATNAGALADLMTR
ncbi:hypothetical protein [Streptomyces chartreusis]|uniref:hypothetical protein n=1 Tax=Streptomyces chartreusis TaxID=1969 RepID=UPI00340EBC35